MEEKQWDMIAKAYHDNIVSPFYGKVDNPLYDELKKIPDKENKVVADFGCGFFYLGRKLSRQFKKVHASDFSLNMVKIAQRRNWKYPNVKIKKEDMRKLRYKNRFDVVIIINSILMPSYKDIQKVFFNIARSMRKGGQLIMILPSMESVLYYGMLLLNKELEKRKELRAVGIAKKKFERKNYDFFLGHYTEDGDTQKFYYMHEIEYLLRKNGLSNIKFKRVNYSWEHKISSYEPFPKEKPMWDWFVTARK